MRNRIIGAAFVCLIVISSSTSATTIVNGSMNDSSGANYNSFNGLTPPGWLQNFSAHSSASTDIFDQYTTVYGTAWIPSFDGGTFVHSIGVLPGGASGEGVVQSLSGLTVGIPIIIFFEQAISNSIGSGVPNISGFWQVTFGTEVLDSAVMSLPALSSPSGWISQSLTFTPTVTTQDLKFLAMGNFTSPFARIEMGLDNVSIGSVPEPSTIWLLGLGLLGLIGFAKQKTGTKEDRTKGVGFALLLDGSH